MVDALVSGASAARRAGSSPVLGTNTYHLRHYESMIYGVLIFYCWQIAGKCSIFCFYFDSTLEIPNLPISDFFVQK